MTTNDKGGWWYPLSARQKQKHFYHCSETWSKRCFRQLFSLHTSNSPKVVIKWKDTINSDVSGKSTIVNIPNWLSKATLDAWVNYLVYAEYPLISSRVGTGTSVQGIFSKVLKLTGSQSCLRLRLRRSRWHRKPAHEFLQKSSVRSRTLYFILRPTNWRFKDW